jgi:hemerythrin
VYNLIEELRKEHKEIFYMLKTAIDCHVSTDMGQERLFLTRDVLLKHLRKEDSEFYPVLYKAAKSDEKLENLLYAYEDNMREVTKLCIEFFEN